jgi:hypothetical protein
VAEAIPEELLEGEEDRREKEEEPATPLIPVPLLSGYDEGRACDEDGIPTIDRVLE